MPRIKQTPSKHASYVMKKVKKAAAKMKEIKNSGPKVIHTGKVKVPFKPAGGVGSSLQKAKDGLIKQLKRRWRSGTVAKREIRKLTRTTHLLLPRRPFQRLAREVAQDLSGEIRFTPASLDALQHCSEFYLNEFLHNANLARCHAKRETLERDDMRFARFMTPSSMWVTPDRIWEEETFKATPETRVDKKAHSKSPGVDSSSSSKKDKKNKKKKADGSDRKASAAKDTGSVPAPPAVPAESSGSKHQAVVPASKNPSSKPASKGVQPPAKKPSSSAGGAAAEGGEDKDEDEDEDEDEEQEDNDDSKSGSDESSSGEDEEMNESEKA